METIIAERTQCTKDVWKHNFNVTKQALDEERATARAGETELSAGLSALHDAVSHQQREFDADSPSIGSMSPDSGDKRAGTRQSGSDSGTASADHGRSSLSQSASSLTDAAEKVHTYSFIINSACQNAGMRTRYTLCSEKTPARIFFYISVNDVWI